MYNVYVPTCFVVFLCALLDPLCHGTYVFMAKYEEVALLEVTALFSVCK